MNSTTKFIPVDAGWSKLEIITEVNESVEASCYGFLDITMVSDELAQEFVDIRYQWLQESLGRSEQESLDAEFRWQTLWYAKIRALRRATRT